MTDKPEKALWELEAEEALKTGDADHFTPQVIKLIIARLALTADSPGAQTAAAKTLAQTEAMLVQVTKDDVNKKHTDAEWERICKGAAEEVAAHLGFTPEEQQTLEDAYMAKLPIKAA